MLLGASPPLHIELSVRSEMGIDKRKEETRKKDEKITKKARKFTKNTRKFTKKHEN